MDVLLDSFHRLAPWAFAVLLIGAAWSDARSYLIPDRYSLVIALLHPAYALTGSDPSLIVGATAVGTGVLLIAAGLFAGGLMGGGDVKLLSAAALWAGPAQVVPFLLVVAMAGGLLSLLVLLRVRAAAIAGRPVAAQRRCVPYGLAIAAGGLYVASRFIVV